MYLIYCSDPLNVHRPDPVYELEVEAAKQSGLCDALINFEALVQEDNPQQAVARVPKQADTSLGIYRGWMLTPGKYEHLYRALNERGIRLINDPAAYRHCHYLPESYPVIEPFTPKSVWLPTSANIDFDQVMRALGPFGSAPILVKDYVKSQKHYWREACYIPSASDRERVEQVVTRFVQLQGSELNEGLVFRQFIELEPAGEHPKSGMPIGREFRLFFLNKKPLYSTAYWGDVPYRGDEPPMARFTEIACQIQSQFFTMDVARKAGGEWMIIELGDGQVAGLPESTDVVAFYTALKAAVSASFE